MNEKNIQQVLDIEKQAQEIYDKAKRDAQEMPVKADQESQALIAKAKAEAQEEARKIISSAQSDDGSNKILADVDAKAGQFETLAKANFDKAVAYVLERVIGKA
jgi:vacuolar-type H+-ATPase subunit H